MVALLVVATIIVFLTIEWAVRRIQENKSVSESVQAIPQMHTYPVRLPEGIFFAKTHTWLNLFPSGKLNLGIDDFVGRLLDQPSISYLKREGEQMSKGEPILILSEGNRSLTMRAPVDGTIVGRNEELPKNPTLLKDSLFIDGWAYTIKPRNVSEIKSMLFGEETHAWIASEFRKLRDVFAGTTNENTLVPALLQDGGPPVAGALKHMNDEVWNQFEQQFLS